MFLQSQMFEYCLQVAGISGVGYESAIFSEENV